MGTSMSKKYLTAKETAEKLNITYPTLLARIRKGKIKAEKFGWALMVPVKEVERHLEKKSA